MKLPLFNENLLQNPKNSNAAIKKKIIKATQNGVPIWNLPSIGALALNLKMECTVLGRRSSSTFRCILAVSHQYLNALTTSVSYRTKVNPTPIDSKSGLA